MVIAGGPAAGRDLSNMAQDEIASLQRQLSDAKCYGGPVDGKASAVVTEAQKRCPAMDPMLVIETGMHIGAVKKIGVDRSCRLLATGSDDKTVRLWSLPEGAMLSTVRLPIGLGNGGKIYAVAVSPDGRLVAAGGSDARWPSQKSHGVHLFDPDSGALKAWVGAFEEVINDLAFSPDGQFLAAMLGGGKGLRVVDVEAAKIVAEDRRYGDDSYGGTFSPDGHLFIVSFDGFLRVYNRAFRLVKKVATRGGTRPMSVAVDPQGERVAVGFQDRGAVDVYRTSDLGFLFAADVAGITGAEGSRVAWSADGTRLVAATGMQVSIRGVTDVNVYRTVVVWDDRGQGVRSARPAARRNITSIQPCGNGFAIAAADPSFGLLDRDGGVHLAREGAVTDLRGIDKGLQVARDGRQVRFGIDFGKAKPLLFDLPHGTLTVDATASGLAPPLTRGLSVSAWLRSVVSRPAGRQLPLEPDETLRTLAMTPDDGHLVLGTDWHLFAFDPQGRKVWGQTTPDVTWGVNATENGRLVIAAYNDGTIRWHRMSDGQELLALFVHREDKRWVAWTPSGYYMASPGGEDLIGWHVNRGWDQAADFFPASRFRERFNRPDIVQAVLDTLDEDAAVKQANATSRRRDDTTSIASRLPPVVNIVSPAPGSAVNGPSVEVSYTVRSPSGLAIDRVEVLVNGRPVETRGLGRSDIKGEERRSVTVQVPPADVEIARSGELAGEAARVRLTYAGAKPVPGDVMKPKLYALVIGVGNYADANLKLGLPAKDARDFARTLEGLKGGLYGEVVVKIATDREVTRTAVVEGLEWLEKQVTSRDVGLVFLAGHGVMDEKLTYWFLPSDATAETVRSRAVSQDDLRRSLRALSGKALLFLDTCHAGRLSQVAMRGAVDINRVVNDFTATENGIVTFASSQGREQSQERPEWGNGAFTKAIIEGIMEGKADLLKNGTITVSQLDAYVVNRVKELTGGTQHPVMTRPPTVSDFPIAVVGAR